ncbi:tetratricopeptide repeat protein [Mangrovibacterium diazotrophicum]|uniref:Tetratricopeptide repeat protein n=1 Tax=Mangrovibacterium diazotrophicum TaxID=1261403 RepID=A0A419W687_9BACT|nr:hypothetical protein [Mangrovibacterium diazotrophicum]RKD90978.1 hypothetical protein BC643_1325 [Mangrovibacterium diazotrophicum]
MTGFRQRIGLMAVALTVVLASCSTSKVVVMHQDVAKQMEAEGNYAAATESWSAYFNEQTTKGTEVSAESYAQAAKVAVKADRKDLAESWYVLAAAGGYSDPEMQLELAEIYRGQNEIPNELTALETFKEKYAAAPEISEVNGRLFELYAMMKKDEQAKAIWSDLNEEQRHQKEYLDDYFKIVSKGEDKAAIEAVAEDLVKADPENVKALEWLGETYYHKAENSYQAEMKAYEKKHTQVQYLHLTQELKVINGNFKKSLECFSTLWDLDQKKSYATYLTNIYARFDNKSKADYYRKFVN